MDFLRYSGVRIRLGLIVCILFLLSLVEREKAVSSKMFVAAVFGGLIWLVIAGYMWNKSRDRIRSLNCQGDVLDLENSLEHEERQLPQETNVNSNKIRNISIIAILAVGGIIVATSDLQLGAKIKVFCAIAFFAALMFTRTVRKHLDPSYGDDEPNEPVKDHDIGPTDGDLPSRDTPTFLRFNAVKAQHNPFFLEPRK